MNHWNNLNYIQKLLFGIAIIIAIVLLPELTFFVKFGGVELIFGFMVMYVQSCRAWFDSKIESIKHFINITLSSLLSTVAFKPRVYYTQATFCILAFAITGSLSLAMVFFMPGLLVSNLMM